MLKSNVHPKVVSERLGHSTVSITLDLYSYVVPGLQEVAALVDDMLGLHPKKEEVPIPGRLGEARWLRLAYGQQNWLSGSFKGIIPSLGGVSERFKETVLKCGRLVPNGHFTFKSQPMP